MATSKLDINDSGKLDPRLASIAATSILQQSESVKESPWITGVLWSPFFGAHSPHDISASSSTQYADPESDWTRPLRVFRPPLKCSKCSAIFGPASELISSSETPNMKSQGYTWKCGVCGHGGNDMNPSATRLVDTVGRSNLPEIHKKVIEYAEPSSAQTKSRSCSLILIAIDENLAASQLPHITAIIISAVKQYVNNLNSTCHVKFGLLAFGSLVHISNFSEASLLSDGSTDGSCLLVHDVCYIPPKPGSSSPIDASSYFTSDLELLELSLSSLLSGKGVEPFSSISDYLENHSKAANGSQQSRPRYTRREIYDSRSTNYSAQTTSLPISTSSGRDFELALSSAIELIAEYDQKLASSSASQSKESPTTKPFRHHRVLTLTTGAPFATETTIPTWDELVQAELVEAFASLGQAARQAKTALDFLCLPSMQGFVAPLLDQAASHSMSGIVLSIPYGLGHNPMDESSFDASLKRFIIYVLSRDLECQGRLQISSSSEVEIGTDNLDRYFLPQRTASKLSVQGNSSQYVVDTVESDLCLSLQVKIASTCMSKSVYVQIISEWCELEMDGEERGSAEADDRDNEPENFTEIRVTRVILFSFDIVNSSELYATSVCSPRSLGTLWIRNLIAEAHDAYLRTAITQERSQGDVKEYLHQQTQRLIDLVRNDAAYHYAPIAQALLFLFFFNRSVLTQSQLHNDDSFVLRRLAIFKLDATTLSSLIHPRLYKVGKSSYTLDYAGHGLQSAAAVSSRLSPMVTQVDNILEIPGLSLTEVEARANGLDTNSIMILDAGVDLFVWKGFHCADDTIWTQTRESCLIVLNARCPPCHLYFLKEGESFCRMILCRLEDEASMSPGGMDFTSGRYQPKAFGLRPAISSVVSYAWNQLHYAFSAVPFSQSLKARTGKPTSEQGDLNSQESAPELDSMGLASHGVAANHDDMA